MPSPFPMINGALFNHIDSVVANVKPIIFSAILVTCVKLIFIIRNCLSQRGYIQIHLIVQISLSNNKI